MRRGVKNRELKAAKREPGLLGKEGTGELVGTAGL